MGFRYLDVRKSHQLLVSKQPAIKSLARRSFLRTLCIGVLVWSLLIEAVFAISNKPFRIIEKHQQLYVFQRGQVAWEISNRIFAEGYQLEFKKGKENYQISGKGLRFHHTDFIFDLNTVIELKQGEWRCKIHIPQLQISKELNFLSWLDGKGIDGTLKPYTIVNNSLISIRIKAPSVCQLDAAWNLNVNAEKSVVIKNTSGTCIGSAILLSPNSAKAPFIKQTSKKVSYLTLKNFDDWYRFVNIHLPSHPLAMIDEVLPDLHMQLNDDLIFWTSDRAGRINHKLCGNNAFDQSFLFTEYYINKEMQIYLITSLNDCWMPTDLRL